MHAIVIADLLEKQGRLIAEGFESIVERRLPLDGRRIHDEIVVESATTLERRVQRQITANEYLRQAFIIYRSLLGEAESPWESRSRERCWICHRLGGILEHFGLRKEALQLYCQAFDGRREMLGSDNEVTCRSRHKKQALENSGV